MEESSHKMSDWLKAIDKGETPHGNPCKWWLVAPGTVVDASYKYWVGKPPVEVDGKLTLRHRAGVVLPKDENGFYMFMFTA